MKNYEQELFESYYSTHYKHYLPQTPEEWNWVIERIELNFGETFSSISKDGLILDVPCGIGYLEHYLIKKGFTKIHAIDISSEQIDVAREKLEAFGSYKNNVKFEAADVFDHLKEPNRYDAIVILDFLEHLAKDKIIQLLKLSYRALQEDGILIVRVSNADNPMFAPAFYKDFTHETPFTLSSMRQCLSLGGFKALKIDYEIMPELKRGKLSALPKLRQRIRSFRRSLFEKFFAIPVSPAAFSEDLIAIARK